MPEQTSNEFTELVTDLHQYNTPKTVMTDAINATVTTDGENQFILQNMASNEYASQLTSMPLISDPFGPNVSFQPLGIAVYKNIAYILSGQFDANGNFERGEIGTYPSPDWSNLNYPSTNWPLLQPPANISSQFVDLKPVYSPLYNFISGGFIKPSGSLNLDSLIDNYISTHTPTPTREEAGNIILNQDVWYSEAFRTSKFDFKNDRLIEVELQESYDNSINIIFTDNSNKVRLVNSRFILSPDGKKASLANRRQSKDTNVYSEERFFSTNLLRTSDKIADLDLIGVEEGGTLPCGNYKVYIKYIDTDGSLSDLVEESRLISVGLGNKGGKSEEVSGRYIHMKLKNLDYKFSSVKLYYSYFTGDTESVGVLKEILNVYSMPTKGSMDLYIYGNEITKDINSEQFNLDYSSINTVRTFTQHDDRLVDANITNSNKDLDIFKEISQQIAIYEFAAPDFTIKPKDGNAPVGYADPNNVYYRLGLWAGETYELGICYILTNGRGVTPSFPLRGIDNVLSISSSSNYTLAPSGSGLKYEPILDADGYYTSAISSMVGSIIPNAGEISKENRLGVFRTKRRRTMLYNGDASNTNTGNDTPPTVGLNRFGNKTNLIHPTLDIGVLYNVNPTTNKYYQFITENVEGFFFVRKERKKDCIMQGYIVNANRVYLYPFLNSNSSQGRQWDRINLPTPSFAGYSNHILTSLDQNSSVTVADNLNGKIVPHPGQLMEMAITKTSVGAGFVWTAATDPEWYTTVATQAGNPGTFNISKGNNFYMYGPQSYAAFYTPDMLVDAPLVASIFNNSKKGMMISNSTIRMGSVLDSTQYMVPGYLLNNYWKSDVIKKLELNDNTFNPEYNISFGYTTNIADNYFQYVGEYQDAFADNQFSALSNRNLYCRISNVSSPLEFSGLSYGGWAGDSASVAGLGVDSTRYSDYVGIRFVTRDPEHLLGPSYGSPTPGNLWGPLRGGGPNHVPGGGITPITMEDSLLSSYPGSSNVMLPYYDNAAEAFLRRFQFEGIDFGAQANIYNSEIGATLPSSLTNNDWKNKYSNNNNSEAYYAMSKRTKLKDIRSNPIYSLFGFGVTTGGDCYINYSYKRAWYAPGIDGVPTASEPRNYTENNLDSSLSEKGMVFPMVCESNYNTSMRSTQLKDSVEQALYGKERTFYPLDTINNMRKSRQLESKGYNQGYNIANSTKYYLNLDDQAPAFGLSYDTRILISAPSISGSFVNGYTDFSGLNFRDYSKNLGQIVKVISQNGVLYCVQENGVSIVPMNQRTMVSEKQGGVFLDDGDLLGQKLQYISTEYGSDQQFSVIKSDSHIYGCTFDKNKIWRIQQSETGQTGLVTISDFKIQKILNDFKKRCLANNNTIPFVKTNYDRRTNTIIFSYFCIYKSKFTTDSTPDTDKRMTSIGSVYFNETTGKWISKLTWDPIFMFNIGSEVYSFNSKDNVGKIWKHFSKNFIKCNFYGKQEKFEFEFIVVEDSTRQKILNNLLVVCNREFPGRLTLSVDDDINVERPDTLGGTPVSLGVGIDSSSTGPNIISTVQPMRQRHENFKYNKLGFGNSGLYPSSYMTFDMSKEEGERLEGGSFVYLGNTYIFGDSHVVPYPSSNQLNIEILDINRNIVPSLSGSEVIKIINFGTFKQNMEYIEDHLYIEISKNKENSRIRDKYIKVRFSYEGVDYITIQKIISLFDYSFN